MSPGLLAGIFVLLVVMLALVEVRRVSATKSLKTGGRPPKKPQGLGGFFEPTRALRWEPSDPRCFTPALVADALRAVCRTRGRDLSLAGQRRFFAVEARRLSAAHPRSRPVTAAELERIFVMETAHGAGDAARAAQRVGPALAALAKAGTPVLTIASQYGLPPLAVLRGILISAGYPSAEVRALIAEPRRLPSAGPFGHLAAEGPAIMEADLGSRAHADRVRDQAQAFEAAVGARLRALGADFWTEEESRRNGAALTPDFLLKAPVRVNGRPVHWLDAKAFPMVGSRLVAKKMAQQAIKYTVAFGPGAFVFDGGIVCGAAVEGDPLLLEGRA